MPLLELLHLPHGQHEAGQLHGGSVLLLDGVEEVPEHELEGGSAHGRQSKGV